MSTKALCFLAVLLERSFVSPYIRLSMLPRYLMNNSLGETGGEYVLAPADDLIRFWRSKVNGRVQSRLSRSNPVNTRSLELLEQSGPNVQGIFTSPD